jgi:dephospho-CoA kinase
VIIGLTGYAGSGKDEVANILVKEHGFIRVAFADKIKEFLYEIESDRFKAAIDHRGWDRAKQIPLVRRALQDLGMSGRKVFGENFWVEQALSKLNS